MIEEIWADIKDIKACLSVCKVEKVQANEKETVIGEREKTQERIRVIRPNSWETEDGTWNTDNEINLVKSYAL